VFIPTIAVSSNTTVCLGKTAQISASGADSYAWSTGQGFAAITVTPNANSVYTVTGTASQNGVTCTNTNTVSVNVNPNPTVTASSTRSAICIGESAVIDPAGAATYSWSSISGPLAGQSITVSPIVDQTYSVSGTDANGCKGAGSFQLKVATCVGIEKQEQETVGLLIYPNPNNGEFTIHAPAALSVKIVNMLGQKVKTVALTHGEANISGLSEGVYFVIGEGGQGSVIRRVIVTK
jgi:hypothetical protein